MTKCSIKSTGLPFFCDTILGQNEALKPYIKQFDLSSLRALTPRPQGTKHSKSASLYLGVTNPPGVHISALQKDLADQTETMVNELKEMAPENYENFREKISRHLHRMEVAIPNVIFNRDEKRTDLTFQRIERWIKHQTGLYPQDCKSKTFFSGTPV